MIIPSGRINPGAATLPPSAAPKKGLLLVGALGLGALLLSAMGKGSRASQVSDCGCGVNGPDDDDETADAIEDEGIEDDGVG